MMAGSTDVLRCHSILNTRNIQVSSKIIMINISVSSSYLMGDVRQLNSEEAKEIRRRNLAMLCYLLRSPFYDAYTK